MFRILLSISTACLLPLFSCYGQVYTPKPCPVDTNHVYSDFKNDLRSGQIVLPAGLPNNAKYLHWASSVLKPSGEPPAKNYEEEGYGDDIGSREYDARVDAQVKYDEWSCQYSPYSATDENHTTAWVEGSDGNGIGEMMIANVSLDQSIRVWNGYGKSKALYRANNRVKKAKIYILFAKGRMPVGPGPTWGDITIHKTFNVILQDRNGYQTIQLPDINIPDNVRETFVAIEILSVYEGTEYDDTCITEVGD